MFKFQISVHENILIIKKTEDKRSQELKIKTKEYFKEEIKEVMEGIFVESDWELNGSQIAVFEDSKALKDYVIRFVQLLNKMHIYALYDRLLKPYIRKNNKVTYIRSIYGDFIIEQRGNIHLIKHTFEFSPILNKHNDIAELSNHFKNIYPKEIFTNFCDYYVVQDSRIDYFRDTILDLMDQLPKLEINRGIIDSIGCYINYWHYFDNLDRFTESSTDLFYQGELNYNEINI